jgi:hypothetical protein
MNNPSSRAFVLARCPVTSSVKQSPSWDAEWPGNSLAFFGTPSIIAVCIQAHLVRM